MGERYTAAQVIDALTATKGMIYLAAEMLGCNAETIRNYARRYPSVEAAKLALRGRMVDLAELRLHESIERGEPWGISLCLRTLGKDRGYVEQQKLALTDPSGEHSWEPAQGLAALL